MPDGQRPGMTPIHHSGGSIAQVIVDSIARFCDRIAVFDDEKRWTYAEFGRQIGRFVTFYESIGLVKGTGIAVLTSNRVDVWPAICAANIMGIRYTPLHPLASEDEQAFVVADAEVAALLVDGARYGARGRALRSRTPSIAHLLSIGPIDGARDVLVEVAACTPAPLVDRTDPEDTAWLTYTGGTTGRSKGVLLPHRSIAAMSAIIAAEWEWPERICYAVITPVSHAAGILLYPVMLLGGAACFMKGFDEEGFCRAVEAERITATFLVPTLVGRLIEAKAVRQRYDLTSLELLVYGAAPIAPDRLREGIEALGGIFLQLYGQSEAPNVITTLRKVDHDLARPHLLGSCGKPTSLSAVKLLDTDMREVEVGAPGEICVRGPLCCNGYWRQPQLTDALFRGGWLHTGDIAIRDAEGYLHIVDRTSDLIISGGVNIYPREVEDTLMAHAAVLAAGAIGVPDAKWGEAVKAFVTLRVGASVTPAELQAHVRERRGGPWAPKSIEILAELPLTSLGKLDRKALRAPYWEGRQRGVA